MVTLAAALGCARMPAFPILDPPLRASRPCLARPAPPPEASRPGAVTASSAPEAPRVSEVVQDLRVRARGLAAVELLRGDRASVERTLGLVWQGLREMAAIADALPAQGDSASRATALAVVAAAYERVADLEARAHELVVLSAEQELARDRMVEEARRLESQSRHARSRHEARRLDERAAAIRARAATLLQASASQVRERHGSASRGARVEAMIRHGRAVWTADQGRGGGGVEEIGHSFERLLAPEAQGVVLEALRQQTEFTYTPGMFLEMRTRWLVGY